MIIFTLAAEPERRYHFEKTEQATYFSRQFGAVKKGEKIVLSATRRSPTSHVWDVHWVRVPVAPAKLRIDVVLTDGRVLRYRTRQHIVPVLRAITDTIGAHGGDTPRMNDLLMALEPAAEDSDANDAITDTTCDSVSTTAVSQ